jgi:MYXO-CTERM domain-containing protein
MRLQLVAAVGVVGLMTLPASADTLFDNGPPDGINGYSNATSGVFGFRRTVLDDFTVPDGGWIIQDFHWNSVWGTLPAGSGVGGELTLWSDAGGVPGAPMFDLAVNGYSEAGTGNTFFNRPEAEHWVTFEDVALGAGTYWMEWTVVGPENNFALTSAPGGNECWVNYDDLGGLQSGTTIFGVAANMNFTLTGIPAPGALALLGLAGLAGSRRRRA